MPKNKQLAMNYRSATIAPVKTDAPATIDEATRSVDVVLATETPCLVFDWERGIVNEVLLMSGAIIPESRQVVMLDTHSRYETARIIGSTRDIRTEGQEMLGRSYFSTAPEAESPWIKTKEGHLTDFSAGYKSVESLWIPEGQTQVIEGRSYEGPLQVTTKWILRELSAVPIGADENAKARSLATDEPKEETQMDKKVREILEKRGLASTATEDEAWAFLSRMEVKDGNESDHDAELEKARAEAHGKELEKVRAEATGKELDRIREIDAMLEKYDCQDMARELIVGGKTLTEARQVVMDKIHEKSKNPGFSGIRQGVDERDKFRAAANDALWLRAGHVIQNPTPGAQELRGYSLVEMARECLRMAGIHHHGTVKEMVGRALTTSDFPNILANLANKSMQAGWDGANETWPIWTGVGSVSDFKLHYDNALSEFDDLEELSETGEIKYGKFSEKPPETYRAVTFAKKFRLTRMAIINDDLSALTELPAKRTEAANRKIGDVVYGVIIGNGNMADGYAIFENAHHKNDATGAGRAVPSTTTIAEAIRAMGVQKDIAGKRRLNIRPEFFLAPKALEGSSEVFFKSDRFGSNEASTRVNIYSGDYFTRVYESRLDDDSLTAYYLMGPKGKTVKVVFLNGVQAPIMEMQQPGFTIEGFEYAVSIDVGAYATDFRGMYRNEGA